MIAAIILASGMSKRLGRNKLLLPLGNKRVIEHVIDNVKSSRIKDIYLVYGKDHQEELKKIAKDKCINSIHNEKYYLGQSTSVKKGIQAIGDNYRGAMFLLGDQPFISHKTINILFDKFISYQRGIIVPTYKGKRGNPVVFSKDFFSEINNIEGDKGGRDIIKSYPNKIKYVPINDNNENIDIDSKEDYHRALKLGIEIFEDYRGEWHC